MAHKSAFLPKNPGPHPKIRRIDGSNPIPRIEIIGEISKSKDIPTDP